MGLGIDEGFKVYGNAEAEVVETEIVADAPAGEEKTEGED